MIAFLPPSDPTFLAYLVGLDRVVWGVVAVVLVGIVVGVLIARRRMKE